MVDRPTGVGSGPAPEPTAPSAGSAASAGPPRARIVVNGEARDIPAGLALPDLLTQLGLRPGSVVVELRGAALTPSEAGSVRLADGDTLEIVRAVAGG
ncbi:MULTISPECIES: sulfur carrier protein ThiS [Parafrankia]|uniref:Thiamine biosynthesis protein ThiS n=1 Tax=Parafrankia colletiae TaxID=573497 RepID=A0A1S1QK38_9ACTN|nr:MULTISPECIES: sulfur carrier protein ThiS [Parafrankia]MCK9903941.1 sulfur carrier protein ThiS [Frankia sp. Cpl3]OHV35118.1 thiamine biosynthesis protein ThiS [Parafrankia colletiae]